MKYIPLLHLEATFPTSCLGCLRRAHVVLVSVLGPAAQHLAGSHVCDAACATGCSFSLLVSTRALRRILHGIAMISGPNEVQDVSSSHPGPQNTDNRRQRQEIAAERGDSSGMIPLCTIFISFLHCDITILGWIPRSGQIICQECHAFIACHYWNPPRVVP